MKYTDPDGRMQRDENGELIFTPDLDKNGKVLIEKNGGGATTTEGNILYFDRIPGFLTTDKGNKIRAYKNLVEDFNLKSNCIGSTFADGKYWIEPDSTGTNYVQTILDDEYKEISEKSTNIKVNDIIVFKNYNNKIHHAAVVRKIENMSKNKILVESKNGGRHKEVLEYFRAALPDSAAWRF